MAVKIKKGKGPSPLKTKAVTKAVIKKVLPKPSVKQKVKTKPVVKKPAKTEVLAKKAGPAPKLKEAPPTPYQDIRKILERQKRTLLVEAGAVLNTAFSPESEVFPDWTDQASVETDQNFVLRLREREQHLLKKIDDAIERIGEGNFGICEVCGGSISIQRLKARPVTTLCIECKTKQEVEEKIRQ
jgi:DnaK suppressor protein